MKNLLLSVLTILAFGFSGCDDMMPFQNDDFSKQNLYGEWRPVQYEVDGQTSAPAADQRNDFLQLNEDKTFSCLEKGEAVEGFWNFVPIVKVVNIMSNEDPDNCIPLTVEVATQDELVYTMPTEDGDEMKVWMIRH